MFQVIRFTFAAVVLSFAAQSSAMAAPRLQTLHTAAETRGLEAVGRLDFGNTGFCTASLITSDVVLTAAHCLFDHRTGNRIDPATIAFRAGLRDGVADASRGVRRVAIHPDYDFGDANRLGRVGADLALLELDQPVRLGHVQPFRTQLRVGEGQGVQVVSYSRNRAEAPSLENACNVLTRDAQILVLSCEADYGASGAPVFARFGDELRIVSVISAKAKWGGQDVSLAAVMDGKLDALISEFARTPAVGAVRVDITDTQLTSARK